jgi:hypothetical protein
MVDRLRENLARFIQAVSGMENVVDLGRRYSVALDLDPFSFPQNYGTNKVCASSYSRLGRAKLASVLLKVMSPTSLPSLGGWFYHQCSNVAGY